MPTPPYRDSPTLDTALHLLKTPLTLSNIITNLLTCLTNVHDHHLFHVLEDRVSPTKIKDLATNAHRLGDLRLGDCDGDMRDAFVRFRGSAVNVLWCLDLLVQQAIEKGYIRTVGHGGEVRGGHVNRPVSGVVGVEEPKEVVRKKRAPKRAKRIMKRLGTMSLRAHGPSSPRRVVVETQMVGVGLKKSARQGEEPPSRVVSREDTRSLKRPRTTSKPATVGKRAAVALVRASKRLQQKADRDARVNALLSALDQSVDEVIQESKDEAPACETQAQ